MIDQNFPPFFPEKGRKIDYPPGRRAVFTRGLFNTQSGLPLTQIGYQLAATQTPILVTQLDLDIELTRSG